MHNIRLTRIRSVTMTLLKTLHEVSHKTPYSRFGAGYERNNCYMRYLLVIAGSETNWPTWLLPVSCLQDSHDHASSKHLSLPLRLTAFSSPESFTGDSHVPDPAHVLQHFSISAVSATRNSKCFVSGTCSTSRMCLCLEWRTPADQHVL